MLPRVEAHEALERFEHAEHASEARERFGRHIAGLVAILAALLAVATLSASQSTENTIIAQAKSTDAFNELEANSLKKHINNNDAALLGILAKKNPKAQAVAAALTKAVSVKYEPNEARLLATATRFEAQRDRSEEHHRGFQLAEGVFQLAIVLSTVAIVARLSVLALVAGGLGLVGLGLLLDGFLLFVKLH